MALAHVEQVMTGCSKVEIAPVGIISDSTVWTELFHTLRDTTVLDWPEPSPSNIEIDQADEPLKVIYKAGVATLKMEVPDIAKEILTTFFDSSTPVFAPAGYDATGLSTNPKTTNYMVKVTSDDGKQVFIITNASGMPGMKLGNTTTAAAVMLTFTALAPSPAGEPKPVIIYTQTNATPTTYTWKKYASDANGTGMSDVRGSLTYIGLAFDKTSAVESTNAADYHWELIEA